MSLACLVLASGLSRRFGQDDKLLADLKGQALLAYCLDAAKEIKFDDYFVVAPENAERAKLARSRGFTIIDNPEPEIGQGHSLALGAAHIMHGGYDAACILLGDMPFVTSAFLKKLIKSSRHDDVTFSRNETQDMPPAIFRGDALMALTKLEGDQGAKSLDLSVFRTGHLDLPNDLARDMDRPEDFDR